MARGRSGKGNRPVAVEDPVGQGKRRSRFGGFDGAATCEVENRSGAQENMTGPALESRTVTLPPRSFPLIFYRKR
jgi:hypothetical protein